MEDENDFQEKHIRKEQNKKLSKHFDILINGQKFKIVNYLFKTESKGDRKGEYIRLLSKFDIIISERENVKIEIYDGENVIKIIGDWASTSWKVGNYSVEYWINDLTKD